MEPGLRPVAMEGGDWTWKMTKQPGVAVGSPGVAGDRSLRFSNAQRRPFMLSSLPSTATTATPRFPPSDITARLIVALASRFRLLTIFSLSLYNLLLLTLVLSFWGFFLCAQGGLLCTGTQEVRTVDLML